ncbi:hypothetical protein [Halobellus ruber]|uniref:Uncharacterized protein n=1 Tax=Halobellus ruber TaxID=2761102 RepID=A0A7J9SNW5_9EURY|nr:hypothetical protein [Halobellus ruber]MBB6647979.1 hypothetical protein [Halobellus ruber]
MGVTAALLQKGRSVLGGYLLLSCIGYFAATIATGMVASSTGLFLGVVAALFGVVGWWLLFRGIPGTARQIIS